MKSLSPSNLLLIVFIFVLSSCEQPNTTDAIVAVNTKPNSKEYYQLKVYSFDSDEQVKVVDKYLKEAFMPGLKKLGINNIGAFKFKLSEKDSIHKTYVLIPFKTMEQFLNLEDQLNKDEEYLAAGSEYINTTYDQPPYHRIESTLMEAFPDMPFMEVPKLDGPRSERIYELRSYESATEKYYKNKVEMFNEGGEIKLFKRLEFNAVFYGEVISGSKMPNLMYMTTFSDQSRRDKLWEAFFDAPEWKELIAMSKYKKNVSHADIIFLYPTEYSDY